MNEKREDRLLEQLGQEIQRQEFDTQEKEHVFSGSYEKKKQLLLERAEQSGKNRFQFRSLTGAAAAIVIVLGLSTAVYAAVQAVRAVITEHEGTDSINIQIQHENEGARPVLKISPGYVPEGYESCGDGAKVEYYYQGDRSADGFSITDIGYTAEEDIGDVSRYEEVQLKDARAILLWSEGYEYGWNVYLFYEEQGYAIYLAASEKLPKEEVLKICENLCIEETGEIIEAEADSPDTEKEAENGIPPELEPAELADLKESIARPWPAEENVTVTVEEIQVSDQVQTELLNEETTPDYEQVMSYMQEDGSLKPYERIVTEWKDQALTETSLGEVPVKNVEVTLTLQNHGEETQEVLDSSLKRLKEQDGVYILDESVPGYEMDWNFRWVSQYKIAYDNMAYYLDSSAPDGAPNEFYHVDLQAGETKTIHMWYAIPEDELENLYLYIFGKHIKVMQ